MKNFLKKNWTLILVALYIILPDFIPGPFDDAALLLIERFAISYLNKEEKERRGIKLTQFNYRNENRLFQKVAIRS